MRRVLLVEPPFPIPAKSKNHKDFLPIGLLKIAALLRRRGAEVRLVRGRGDDPGTVAQLQAFDPDQVWVTSLFTYWASFVRDTVQHYRTTLPNAKTVVGGIYASLLPKEQVQQYVGCDYVHQGILPEAEACFPAYDLIDGANPHPLDYQIVHASRGCARKCRFCGTWRIEPQFVPARTVKDMIRYRKVVFYDNNFLMNPFVESILRELIELRHQGKLTWCESQSGFDGRVLLHKPHLARMIKEAGFRYPRIAWDWGLDDAPNIEKEVDLLVRAGYRPKEVYVFVLFNWDIPFGEMELKRVKCWEWKVQVADCRFRPLNQLSDNYNPLDETQTTGDYYIHYQAGWTDALVKQFRRNIRQQNICVRHGFPFYSKAFEKKKLGKDVRRAVKAAPSVRAKRQILDREEADYWFPDQPRYPLSAPSS